MNSRERLAAAIAGERPDRVPYTAWHHFYLTPPAGPDSCMAQAELQFFDTLKPDLLKVMHDVDYEPVGPIDEPADWARLSTLDPATGNFGDQLYTLKQIRRSLDPAVPMIDTVFNVYHYAHKLSQGRLLDHLRLAPEVVHKGLSAIAESLSLFAKATLGIGCEGIYFALSGASRDVPDLPAGSGEPCATEGEYRHHFFPYDRQVLRAVMGTQFTILHLHGYQGLYFELVHDLPAAAICWSDRAGGPSLAEAAEIHSGCVMGGLDEVEFGNMSAVQIVAQGRQAIEQMTGRPFILSPGCSIPQDTSDIRLGAIREAVTIA